MITLMNYKKIQLPDGGQAYLPEDIELVFPESDLPVELQHYLAYIPWNEKYMQYVPTAYKDFFKAVLPYLHARTTDVHTAICLPLMDELLGMADYKVDEHLVYLGLILHDSGWSQLSDKEIADSLSYSGLALSSAAKAPKNKHAELGAELTTKILNEFKFEPPLSEADKKTVHDMVLYHDVTKEFIDKGVVTPELYLVSDGDRLWSYTHENFWQDTVRKGVTPPQYASNLSDELDGYFYTEQGKKVARRLLDERRAEVAECPTDI